MSSSEKSNATTRERREARAARRRAWAEGREAKAEAAHQASHDAVAGIPVGQPILSGHRSQRRHERAIERSQSQATRAIEHGDMARHHRDRAANIDAQLERSIFSDDADAVEQLESRIAENEAKRDRIKRYNASCRRGQRDLSILSEDEKRDLISSLKVGFGGANGQFPAFELTNLGGRIRNDKKRLAELKRGESR